MGGSDIVYFSDVFDLNENGYAFASWHTLC